MDGIYEALANDPGLIVALVLGPIAIVTGGIIVTVIMRTAAKNTFEREQTRRELAAYIAEGSMTPEDAERILVPRPWFASSIASGGKHFKEACEARRAEKNPAA